MPDDTLLGLDEPPQPKKDGAYRVLARKYRPQTFEALIGQEPMVRTLENAIKRDRIAHAFLLTGVRGVGKTSTARLIAKALNCVGRDGQGGPTIEPCGVCKPCVAIAEGRDMDVIEMDAASNRGIDDIREVMDVVRSGPNIERNLVYIVDEVHMLTKEAFNALLKTLEEPPPRVKFILATTEVNKVPVTVLSRCQRFDLRRIPTELLAEHFGWVAKEEGVTAEPEALTLIARAAEGSARDGLSILDQAIAHADLEGQGVSAAAVREMLGLSDRGAIRDLFGLLLGGDGQGALTALRRQYDYGVDPQTVLKALLETVHGVTLARLGSTPDAGQPAEEREAHAGWAAKLSFPQLHRLWQLLLKGHEEVARAALPIEAAEMALLRVIHASSLPDPGELARKIASGAAPSQAAPVSATPAEPRFPETVGALVDYLETHGRHVLAVQLRRVRPVRYAPGELAVSASRPIPADFLRELANELRQLSGKPWKVTTEDAAGEPSLNEQKAEAETAERARILASPVVKAAFEAFPDTVLEGWTDQRSSA